MLVTATGGRNLTREQLPTELTMGQECIINAFTQWVDMHIWAVGGGKGGTGKSLIANGLALGLAERGAKVILVDADFGGPNQHTYCGLRKPATTLAQFFEERQSLEDLALDTGVPGLRLIPGQHQLRPTPTASPGPRSRSCSGTCACCRPTMWCWTWGPAASTTPWTPSCWPTIQVGVILPDALAIENFYLFLKNLKYRQLGNLLSGDRAARSGPATSGSTGRNTASGHPGAFVRHLRELRDRAFARRLDQEQERLFLHLVLNQVREYSQVELGLAVKSSMRKYFQINGEFAGYLRYDKDLWQQFGQDPRPGPERRPLRPCATPWRACWPASWTTSPGGRSWSPWMKPRPCRILELAPAPRRRTSSGPTTC